MLVASSAARRVGAEAKALPSSAIGEAASAPEVLGAQSMLPWANESAFAWCRTAPRGKSPICP